MSTTATTASARLSFLARTQLRAALLGELTARGFTGTGGIRERHTPAGRDRVVIARQHHDPSDAPDHVAVFTPGGHAGSIDLTDTCAITRVLALIEPQEGAR